MPFDSAASVRTGPTPCKLDFGGYGKRLNTDAIASGNLAAFDNASDFRIVPVTGRGGEAFAISACFEKYSLAA